MPANEPFSFAADLELIRDAAREAGLIAMRHFRKDPEVWLKDGSSPVSAADIAANDYLRRVLTAARPTYGWLSEETADTPERLTAPRTFVVDPIDGTRAFIEGRTTWCVSVAVVEEGRSVAGVLDCPARDEIYEASALGPALLNGTAIEVARPEGELRIAGPKALIAQAPAHLRPANPVPYIPSLAYRIAMVSTGKLHATFVKANSHDWDLAAADLILSRAGGEVRDPSGERPRYARETVRHDLLVAGSGAMLDEMTAVIAAAAA